MTQDTTKRVLLVDDEELIRLGTGLYLKSIGYEVDEADDGKVAHDLILKRGETYDLLVIDINMPNMNGLELLEALDNAGVRTPRIVMPGFCTDDIADALSKREYFAQITKPFKPSELATLIEQVLQ